MFESEVLCFSLDGQKQSSLDPMTHSNPEWVSPVTQPPAVSVANTYCQ